MCCQHVNTELLENSKNSGAVNSTLSAQCQLLLTGCSNTDQDLAEGLVFQVGQVFCQFTGVEVVKQEGHLPLFGHRWDTLSHLPLPFIRWSDEDDKAHQVL